MKQNKTILTAGLIAVLSLLTFSGCTQNANIESNGITSTETLSDINTAPAIAESSEKATDTAAAEKFDVLSILETPSGDVPDLSEAKISTWEGENSREIQLSDITADTPFSIVCDYVYLAQPAGVSYNSIENSDIFTPTGYGDDILGSFEGVDRKVKYEYKTYKAGDKIGELMLTKALAYFYSDKCETAYNHFDGGFMELTGNLTLTGICRMAKEDGDELHYYIKKGDLFFIPDSESCKIPIMDYSKKDGDGFITLKTWKDENAAVLSEYGELSLGNINDERYKELDFSGIADSDGYVKVKITVNNVCCWRTSRAQQSFDANITDFQVIE